MRRQAALSASSRAPATHPPIELPLHSGGQFQVFAEFKAKQILACCGRRFGKTEGIVRKIISIGFDMTRRDLDIGWLAPTYRQTRIAWRKLRKAMKPWMRDLCTWRKSDKTVEFPNGTLLQMLSEESGVDNLVGDGFDYLIVDEAARIKDETIEELEPTLAANDGTLIAITSPKGKRGWFYKRWVRGMAGLDPDIAAYHFPSSSSPHVSQAFLDRVKRNNPEHVWRQNYLAEWLDSYASPFPSIDALIRGGLAAPLPRRRYAIGIDVGKRVDWMVVVVVDLVTRSVVAFDRFQKKAYPKAADRVAALVKQYPGKVTMDTTGVGEAMYDLLVDRGVHPDKYTYTNRTKCELIERLAWTMEVQGVFFPDIPQLVHELKEFEFDVSANGRTLYRAPSGQHDDCVNALALAVWGMPKMRTETSARASSRTGGRRHRTARERQEYQKELKKLREAARWRTGTRRRGTYRGRSRVRRPSARWHRSCSTSRQVAA